MPQPSTSGADAHRESTDGGEVQVETETGGGDDDPEDPGDEGGEQVHGGDDDDGSLDAGFLTDTRVIIAIVVVSLVVLYFMYEGAKVEGQVGGSGNPSRGSGETAPAATEHNVPVDTSDPLKADEYILQRTGIFPSIARGSSGGPDDPAMGNN